MAKPKILVVGGGPGGATAARTLAEGGADVLVLERSFSRAKPCGGAIPPLVINEFGIPPEIIDCRMKYTTIYSPTGRETDIAVLGSKPTDKDFIGMVRREVYDNYLREQAAKAGAEVIEAKLLSIKVTPEGVKAVYEEKGVEKKIEAAAVIGADGAYSMVARALGAPRVPQCVAMQYRIRLPESQMQEWRETAELYLGDEVSPDFYGWIFPKHDHLSVGVGAGPEHSTKVRSYLNNLVERAGTKLKDGKIYATEAHALPMRHQKKLAYDRAMLIGDAAGMVVSTSGEGIYWAMKSGKIAAETLLKFQDNPVAANLSEYEKIWKKQYGTMYRFLDRLQNIYFGDNRKFEVFTQMCRDVDVQRLTFDSYLHKEMAKLPVTSGLRIFGKMAFNFARWYVPVLRPKPSPTLALEG
ncbi:geranylgeranyl diphosphate reductase [Candidatus Chlorohelix sp.]|uniref:geranylgeranyl diphosphate reductase n=1 Tax=Candidatus Chlorohelix sp. TaxID=3139201 RepID=UPI00304969CA